MRNPGLSRSRVSGRNGAMTLQPADAEFAASLRETLSQDVFRRPEPRYTEEPRGQFKGQAGLLALPRNVDEAAALIRAAGRARVPVVPYGGGTGLVGAQIMESGPAPLIVSLERMNAVRAVYPQENILIAEAGAILADVQDAARAQDRLFPLSLAAQGSARIGGNLSTNAGGVNVLRYGNARDLCLGLEAVLPDGQIWHGLKRLRKDNTGYDLRNLLIGAEGTLGLITAAALKLSPIPQAEGTAMIVVPSPGAALQLLGLAREQVGNAVSAFELIHQQGLLFLDEVLPQVRQPFEPRPEWCVLVELGLSGGANPVTALERLFETAFEAGVALDGVIAQSEGQRSELWTLRENLPEANRLIGAIVSTDISLPLGVIPEFIEEGGRAIAGIGAFRINCFGHLGDGNLHYNVFPEPGGNRAAHKEQKDELRLAIHQLVQDMGGSFSAEHGVGRLKISDLEQFADPAKLSAMRAIKAALDPAGIMNPGAVLRASAQ